MAYIYGIVIFLFDTHNMYIKYIELWRFIILKAFVNTKIIIRGLYSTCITYVIYRTGMFSSFMCTVLVCGRGFIIHVLLLSLWDIIYEIWATSPYICTIHISSHCAWCCKLRLHPKHLSLWYTYILRITDKDRSNCTTNSVDSYRNCMIFNGSTGILCNQLTSAYHLLKCPPGAGNCQIHCYRQWGMNTDATLKYHHVLSFFTNAHY